MIRFFCALFASVLITAAGARADIRDVYTIRDIPVDERADTVIEAQRNAFAEARLVAARALIERITLAEDRADAGGVALDLVTAQGLASAVDVLEETRGGGRYLGVLSVVLNPAATRQFLNARGIPFVDAQAPLALLAPVSDDSVQFDWTLAFGESGGSLTPFTTATEFYWPDTTWTELAAEVAQTDARRGVIANLRGRPGAYRVEVSIVTPAGTTSLGLTRNALSLEDAAVAAIALLESAWKRQAIIRSSERTLIEANVFYTSIVEWNGLRAALVRSPLVSDFNIKAISGDGAVVRFAFAGGVDRLTNDLRERGVSLDADPAGFVLTSAMTGAP